MKVLITGATGFIGREIVAELSEENFDIYQVGNLSSSFSHPHNKFFRIDITNFEEVRSLRKLGDIDAIIHSAGLAHQFGDIEKEKFYKTNVEGTKNILELAITLKVRHLVLISSTAIYGTEKKTGNDVKVIDENAAGHPQTFYAESKFAAEQAAIEICRQNNINLTIFRLSPVIGEGNTGNVARMVEAIDKKRFIWIGRGDNYKSLIYKNDVARACREILIKKKNGIEVFNLAAEAVPMRDFVAGAAAKLNKRIPKFSVSPGLLEKLFLLNEKTLKIKKIKKISQTVEKWLSDDVYSGEKIKREYNFKPEIPVKEALEKQISWYQRQKGITGDGQK